MTFHSFWNLFGVGDSQIWFSIPAHSLSTGTCPFGSFAAPETRCEGQGVLLLLEPFPHCTAFCSPEDLGRQPPPSAPPPFLLPLPFSLPLVCFSFSLSLLLRSFPPFLPLSSSLPPRPPPTPTRPFTSHTLTQVPREALADCYSLCASSCLQIKNSHFCPHRGIAHLLVFLLYSGLHCCFPR